MISCPCSGPTLSQVSSELIRVSILWHEMWHEALEEASRLYFGEQNVEGMLGVLLPLHEKIEQEQAVTLKEISFVQARRHADGSWRRRQPRLSCHWVHCLFCTGLPRCPNPRASPVCILGAPATLNAPRRMILCISGECVVRRGG